MTSDGPYPPGYEPADGPPYGRYPADEPDGRGQPTAPGRPAQGSWAPPQEDYFTPPGDRFAAQGGDRFTPPAYPPPGPVPSGPTAGPGGDRPGSTAYPSQAPYNGGWQPETQAGFGGGFGSGSVPRPPEPARGGESAWPADPTRPTSPPPTGRVSGSASVGSASVGGASMGSVPVGGPAGGAPGRSSTSGVYGTPTQYGSPTQYGGGGSRPGEYGSPTQYGAAPAGSPGQFGANQPTQYGAAPVGAPGQFGANQPGQYGAPGQYGSAPDPAMARFRPDESDGDGQPPAKSRRGLIIGLAVAGVVLVALAAVAIVASMSGGKSGNYPVGSCVKQSGDKATSVSCSESGAYTVVSNVDSPSKCSDQGQPYVLLQQHGVADQVLCLKPAH